MRRAGPSAEAPFVRPHAVRNRHTYGAPDSLVTPRKRVAKLATNRLHVRQLGRVAFGPSALAALILVFALGTTARAHAQAPSTITASYDASEYVIAEGASVTVTVALSEGPPQSTEIPLAVQSGGTAATDDYGGVPSSLTFAVGETAKSFTFTATDESDAEQSETVVLGFRTLPDGVTGGGTSTVTIVDDDNGVNILLITADDLNWHSVGVFGSPVEGATPNLDRLAAAGMRFEHAHVMVAVCTPSRSAVMTGRYPNLSGGQGFHDLRMEGVPILPAVLRYAGYAVGVLGRVNASTPYDETTFEWDMAEAKDLGKERNPEAYYSRMKTFVQGATEEGRPFFLMVNSADPHRRLYGNDPDEWYDDLDPPAAVPSRTFSADEVATYTTTDPEDQTVIWQLTGEDQGRFVFSNGLLRFVTTPDFESPADAGGNNEYSVTVRASDGANTVAHAVTVTVTNEEEPGTLSLSSSSRRSMPC